MNTETSSKTTIYFDSSDPNNIGIAYRTRYSDGSEDSGPVDGLAGEAIMDIFGGRTPSSEGLDDVRNAFFSDVVLDGVGEIFQDWRQ